MRGFILILGEAGQQFLSSDLDLSREVILYNPVTGDAAEWGKIIERFFTFLSDQEADSADFQVSVIADLRELKVASLLGKLRNLPWQKKRSGLYLIWPRRPSEDVEKTLLAEFPVQPIFVFPDSSMNLGKEIINVLRVHEVGNFLLYLQRDDRASCFLMPKALSLDSRVYWRTDGATPKDKRSDSVEGLLASAFDSVEIFIQDLRCRMEDLLKLSEGALPRDLETFSELLKPLNEVILHASNIEGSTNPIQWDKWLTEFPRGFEAEARFAASLQERCLTQREAPGLHTIVRLVEALPPPAHDPNWKEERIKIKEDCKDLDSSIPKHPVSIYRETLSTRCLQLLRLLGNPLVRRNLLESFLWFVWEKHGQTMSDRVSPGTMLRELKSELRLSLREVNHGSAFLVLPKESFSEEEGEDVCLWFENLLRKPCTFMLAETSKAWLYIEVYVDPFSDWSVREEGPTRRMEGQNEEQKAVRSPLSERCPVCESDPSIPSLQTPADFEIKSEMGTSPPPTCPQCQRLNGKDWWLCTQHDKIFVPVPIDKDRCPDCILRHHEDPIQYPLSSIGVRPGLAEPFLCPNCEEIQKERPWHEPFKVEKDLVPFYKNGVNGHDSAKFPELAAKYGLLDGYRCPGCATLLIPVHHRMLRVH